MTSRSGPGPMVHKALASLLVISLAVASAAGQSKDHGVYGEVFEIGEPDLMTFLESRLRQAEADGSIAEMNQKVADRVLEGVRRPPPVLGLSTLKATRSWLYDPSITVPQDFADHNGVVFAHRGETINPLETMTMRKHYLFVDGDDGDQIRWAVDYYRSVDGQASIILTNGAPLELMEEHQVRMFFDQKSILTQRFSITAVPASVKQEGVFIRITEHGEPEWKGGADG